MRWQWKQVVLGLLALGVVVCGGGAWWFAHPTFPWEGVTTQLPPVVWEGHFSADEQQAVLPAWALATLEGGELWVGELPPDVSLALPQDWQVLGAIRQGASSAFMMESVWLELPPWPADQAGRQVLHVLSRAGWREPLGERLMRRITTLFGAQAPGFLPPGFVPPEGSPLLSTIALCRREGEHMAQAEISLFRRQEGNLVAVIRFYRPAGMVSCDALPWLPSLPWPPLPFVVKVPTLIPPAEMPVLDMGGDSLIPGTYLAHLTLQTEQSPEAVRRHFDAQLQNAHWRLVTSHEGDKASWSVWQRRSLRGHHYEVRLFVIASGAERRRVTLLFRTRDVPEGLLSPRGSGSPKGVRIHGDLNTAQGKVFLETWLNTQAPEAAQAHLLAPEKAPQDVPFPEQAHLVGGVVLRFRNAWAGSPGVQWLLLWPRQPEGPTQTQVLQTLQRLYADAGWKTLPNDQPLGWDSLAQPAMTQTKHLGWCSPKGNHQVWVAVSALPDGEGWLVAVQDTPLEGTTACAEARFTIEDPMYLFSHLLPDWTEARGQTCGLLLQGMSASAGGMDHHVALAQWAWVKPCEASVEAFAALLGQITQAQGWHLITQGGEGEVRWQRWQRTLDEEHLSGQVVLGLYWLPVGDGWYLGDLTLTFASQEEGPGE